MTCPMFGELPVEPEAGNARNGVSPAGGTQATGFEPEPEFDEQAANKHAVPSRVSPTREIFMPHYIHVLLNLH